MNRDWQDEKPRRTAWQSHPDALAHERQQADSELITAPNLNDGIFFVVGRNHTVAIWGDLVNLCDRVELADFARGPFVTLRGSALQKRVESAHTSSTATAGKGMVTFTIPEGQFLPADLRCASAPLRLSFWGSTSSSAEASAGW